MANVQKFVKLEVSALYDKLAMYKALGKQDKFDAIYQLMTEIGIVVDDKKLFELVEKYCKLIELMK